MNEFARHAQIQDDGTGLSTEQRLQLALITPDDPRALSQAVVTKITTNRIRSAFAELAHGNIEAVNNWLQKVADGIPGETKPDPARAVELYMEFAQFCLPKLKAVAIDVRSPDGSVKTMSINELERIVAEQ